MATDINALDPNATLLRLRELIQGGNTNLMIRLDKTELVDMVLCACGFLAALRELNPALMDAVLSQPADFRNGG